MEYRYTLEPYNGIKSRYKCPACGKQHVFTRYTDTATGEYVHPIVGRCGRELSCGYHYLPKQYFQDNPAAVPLPRPALVLQPKPMASTLTIPAKVVGESLCHNGQNHFISFLTHKLGTEVAAKLVDEYCIGSSGHWAGATVFWQIDMQRKVRTGKIMLYHPSTGKRVKQPYNRIAWAHTPYRKQGNELRQCLFGEHLLRDSNKPVAIVESEKTAVIAAAYLPQFVWLATGSLANLTADKCRILSHRRITLYPDLNALNIWQSKAEAIAKQVPHWRFKISALLQSKATEAERAAGLDLADYLLRFNRENFN